MQLLCSTNRQPIEEEAKTNDRPDTSRYSMLPKRSIRFAYEHHLHSDPKEGYHPRQWIGSATRNAGDKAPYTQDSRASEQEQKT